MTTFVQDLDVQGPAVVQRITTEVGGLACSPETVEQLVNALHTGASVTITGDGKSATFNASGAHLGYGEAYIALALAAQELRNAGISTCATPDQWHAVLLGGPLQTTVTTTSTNSVATAGSSSTFPGIVTLHSQGQGWGQIAQTTNLQLSSVISNTSSSSNTASATNAGSANSTLSPTGYSSADMNKGHTTPSTNTNASKDSDNDKEKDKDKDSGLNKDHGTDTDTLSKPEANPATQSDKAGNGK